MSLLYLSLSLSNYQHSPVLFPGSFTFEALLVDFLSQYKCVFRI